MGSQAPRVPSLAPAPHLRPPAPRWAPRCGSSPWRRGPELGSEWGAWRPDSSRGPRPAPSRRPPARTPRPPQPRRKCALEGGAAQERREPGSSARFIPGSLRGAPPAPRAAPAALWVRPPGPEPGPDPPQSDQAPEKSEIFLKSPPYPGRSRPGMAKCWQRLPRLIPRPSDNWEQRSGV